MTYPQQAQYQRQQSVEAAYLEAIRNNLRSIRAMLMFMTVVLAGWLVLLVLVVLNGGLV